MADSKAISKKRSVILFDDPPLTGIIECTSPSHCTILYNRFKIAVENINFYVNGTICRSFRNVKDGSKCCFEAILQNQYHENGCDFYAILAWVGTRPSIRSVAASVQGPPPRTLGKYSNHVFVGKVLRFFLPSDALVRIRIGGKPTVVGLSVQEFSEEPLGSKYPLISDYVSFKGTYLKFKIKFCKGPILFYAYDVQRSSEKEYHAFCDKTKGWK